MIVAVRIGEPLREIIVTPKTLPIPGPMPSMPAPAPAPKPQEEPVHA